MLQQCSMLCVLPNKGFQTGMTPGGDTPMQKISAAGFLLLILVLWLLFGRRR